MLESLTQFVTILLALSIAAERLVELVKGWFSSLNGTDLDADRERKRQLIIHGMSLAAAFVVVYLAQDYIISSLRLKNSSDKLLEQLPPGLYISFSILASGGSSMWNSILTYLLSLKNLKQQQVVDKVVDNGKARNDDLMNALPSTMPTV